MSGTREWRRPAHLAWGIFAILAVVGVSVLVSSLFFFPRTAPGAPIYPYWYFPFGFHWFFGLFWIFVIFLAVRWLVWPSRGGGGYSRRYWRYGDGAKAILRERYAKGEVTKEQFEQMMRDLEEHQ